MRRSFTVVVLSVCLSVCLLPRDLLPTSFVRQKQSFIGLFMTFQGFCHVAFTENASFKSSGVICWSPPPSSLLGELSMDKRDSNGFFSTPEVYMVSQIQHHDWFITHRSALDDKLLGSLCKL
jgi:hypothetical protein